MVKDSLLEEYFNYNPEKDPSGAYGHSLADRVLERYGSLQNIPKRIKTGENKEVSEKESELEKKAEFIRIVDGMQINPESIFSHRDIKENLIRKYKGYTRLSRKEQKYKEKEKGDYLSDCSDAKIGLVFKDIYHSFLRDLKKDS